LLDYLNLFQLSILPPFQLAGCKSIPGIHRVVLFEGLLRLIHQLLELTRQGRVPRQAVPSGETASAMTGDSPALTFPCNSPAADRK